MERTLWEACRDGDLAVVRSLAPKVKQLSSVAFEEPLHMWLGERVPLLTIAVLNERPEIVWFLLCQWSVDPNQGKVPAILVAARERKFESFKILAQDRRVNLSIPSKGDFEGLLEACIGHSEFTRIILSQGRPIHPDDLQNASIPRNGIISKTVLLSSFEKDPLKTSNDIYHELPFLEASFEFLEACDERNLDKVVKWAPQVDVSFSAPYHKTTPDPLFGAIASRSPEIATFLLTLPQVDLNKQPFGYPPLLLWLATRAAVAPEMIPCLKQLLSRPDANPNVVHQANRFQGTEYEENVLVHLARYTFTGGSSLGSKTKIYIAGPRLFNVVKTLFGSSREKILVPPSNWIDKLKDNEQTKATHKLIMDYEKDWRGVRWSCRQSDISSPSAHMFAQLIFLCDELLKINDDEPRKRRKIREEEKQKQVTQPALYVPPGTFMGYPIVDENDSRIIYRTHSGDFEIFLK